MNKHIQDILCSFGNWFIDFTYDDSLPLGGGSIGGAAIANNIPPNVEPNYTHIMIGAAIGAFVGYMVKKGLDSFFKAVDNHYAQKPKDKSV